MSRKVLIVDDEELIRESVAGILMDEGFDPLSVGSAVEAFPVLETEEIDLVLLDIWMPEMDGMEALGKIKELYPTLPVIMISGHGNIETAVQATKKGAFDFIEKPPSYDKIVLSATNAVQLSQLTRENQFLREKHTARTELSGNSKAITAVKQQLIMVAPTPSWVLIRGEHGTGKELAAQTIHRNSETAAKPMVEVNCAAIPDELIESELFGHEKGAFTGATTAKRGKFDLADGSILFLDEIGDMSLSAQAKVLRILQEQKFERVGGSKTISVDVRVIAATNKDLEEEIEQGRFRADLYYRLNVVPITLPPLRDRLDDIPFLITDIMEDFTKKGFKPKEFLPGAVQVMQSHSWPGNVRELCNFIERVLIMCREESVTGEMISLLLGGMVEPVTGDKGGNSLVSDLSGLNLKDAKRKFEADFLRIALDENDGNISRTAEQIGMERSNLHKKIKQLGLE
jgi:two-component system nitrogen regulation response regulator NtrX